MAQSGFFDELAHEAWEFLKELIKINTTNPPGNELEAIQLIASKLRSEGFASRVLISAYNRGNLVLKVGQQTGVAKLLLHSHVDVVEADKNKWKHDPFSAVEEDGILYGRGTVDMKSALVCQMFTLIALKRLKKEIKQPIAFVCTSDEEAGCERGSRWLVENHADLLVSEYAIGEAGGFRLKIDGNHLYPVQVAEKGVVWAKIRFTGPSGHGSSPKFGSAIEKLSKTASLLSAVPFEYKVTPVAKAFIEGMAGAMKSSVKRFFLLRLLKPAIGTKILRNFISDPEQKSALFAMLHDTATPTVIRAGQKENVVAPTAEMIVDGRILPGQTEKGFIDELKRIVGDAEIEVLRSMPPVESPIDDPILNVMQEALKEEDEKAKVVPFLTPGYTDAKYISKVAKKCYGFTPIFFVEGDKYAELAHGNDERIPFEGFKFGLKVLYRFVSKTLGVDYASDI